ncbi:hypothetical protein NST61_06070 [Caldifermentibacillus hisashii]|uniref:hypothetical protein n=1 Tax=Caldifermentibacillus hisashii TaxID=996558 RepID=UPI0034D6F979
MYQSYSPYYENNENSRTKYYHPMLYPMADYFPAAYDERQFNGFPKEVSHPQGMCRA